MLEKFTIATFADRVGETFRICPDETQTVATELVDVTDLSARAGPEVAHYPRAPFSIVFRGPMSPILPQRIYRLEHDEIGTFELFLVPIGLDREGMRYEAVFA